jgi:cell division protein FtsQ
LALGTTAALAAGGTFAWRFLTTSPRFAVTTLRFTGTRHTSPEELERLLPFHRGENILRARLGDAIRVFTQNPWIASVRAHRELPGTIAIEITERDAAAAVLLGGLYLADGTGMIFKRATLEEADGLLVVTGLDRERFLDDPAASAARVREALAVARTWAARPRPALSEIALQPAAGPTLFLRDGGLEIRLGLGDLDGAFTRFDELARELARRGERPRAILLDSITHPDRATVRLVQEGS